MKKRSVLENKPKPIKYYAINTLPEGDQYGMYQRKVEPFVKGRTIDMLKREWIDYYKNRPFIDPHKLASYLDMINEVFG